MTGSGISSSASDYEIVEFGAVGVNSSADQHAADLAALHAKLLGHSPLVMMGPDFVQEFYYTVLPREGLISGAIAYVDRVAAGFIVATDDPLGFMPKALRSHWLRTSGVLLKSILKSPRRVLALKEAIQIQRNIPSFPNEEGMGELLSFGVLQQFRSRSFIRERSIHIGTDLLRIQLCQLRSAGIRRVRAIVDKDNLAAQIFYRENGWHVGLSDVRGWSVPTMEFLVDLEIDA